MSNPFKAYDLCKCSWHELEGKIFKNMVKVNCFGLDISVQDI